MYKRIYTSIEEDKKLKPEEQTLAKYTSSQVLNSLIVHFSYDFLTRFYLDYFKPDNPLYKKFTDSFKIWYKQDYKTDKFYREIFIENMRPEGRYNLLEPEIKRIEAQAVEISKLMADDLACKKHQDCLSYNCKDRKCRARTYDATQSQGSIQDQSQDEESQQPIGDQDQPICIQRNRSVTRQVKDLSYEPFEEKVRVDEEYNDERFSVISEDKISVKLKQGTKRGLLSYVDSPTIDDD